MNRAVALRAVLFDVDGTLIDTAALVSAALRHAHRVVGGAALYAPEWYQRLIGMPLADQAALLARGREEEFVRASMAYYEANAHREQPFPGVLEVMAAARAAGLKTALVTSKLREEMEPVLTRVPLEPLVDAIVTADMTERGKPAPDPVLKAAELLGVRAEETLFVGDSPFDIAAGREAGARTAAALWGPHPRERLAKEKPDHWLEKPEELRALLPTAYHGQNGNAGGTE